MIMYLRIISCGGITKEILMEFSLISKHGKRAFKYREYNLKISREYSYDAQSEGAPDLVQKKVEKNHAVV